MSYLLRARREDTLRRGITAIVLCLIATASLLMPYAAAGPRPSTGDASWLTEEEMSVLSTINYDRVWDELEYLSGLGEKVAGSPEERAAQEYVKAKLDTMGMDLVTWETFPTKTWVHYGTSVTITSPTTEPVRATTYGDSHSIWGMDSGMPYSWGNADDGKTLIGPVVDAGKGTDAEFDALGDLGGVIALVERDDDLQGWPNVPLEEADAHGAAAVVFYGYYGSYPLADGIKQDVVGGSIPAISISINSADRIKELMASDVVELTIAGRADLIDANSAESVNVAAYLVGSKYPTEYVVFSAHIDTWWAGTSDDNSGIACVLEYARMFSEARAAGLYTNERTLVFCSLGAEEYGGPDDSWYNWLIGSYEWVKANRDKVDRTVVDLNLDMCSIKKTYGRYWVEQSPDMNTFVKTAIDDLGLTGAVTYYNPQYSWVDAWSFHAKGGASAVNVFWVGNQDELYHTQLDNMDLASMEPLKIVMDMYTLLGLRADGALVLPFDMMHMVDYAAGYLSSDSTVAAKDCAYFAAASAALEELREQVAEANAYAAELKEDYAMAESDSERAAIEAEALALNEVLYKARKTVNIWTMGEGGTMGSWDVFPREHQHSHDIEAINAALSALNRGRVANALTALETVYSMEWGRVCSPEAYNTIMSWMWNDVMYWGGEWDQQQAYVNVHWIYLGLADGTLSIMDAKAALKEIKNTQLVPWLQEDLMTLENAWLDAAGMLEAAVP